MSPEIGLSLSLCHLHLAIGAANQVSQISGPRLVVRCRLRPVNSMYLSRKKGSSRCAVKLSFRDFIKAVPNILQTLLSYSHLHLNIIIWAFLDVPDAFPEVILDFINVSIYLDTRWVQNFKIIFFYKKFKSPPQRVQEKLLVWSSPCPEYDSFSGSSVNGNL